VLGLLAAAGAAAKMASKIPRLARLAESLRGKFIKRAKVGGGPAGELAGAPPPEVGAKRATAAGPKEGKAPVEAEAAPAAATPKTNTVTWTRDESGRLVRAEGTLRQTHSGAARSSAEVGAQKKVGKLGIEGDEGGHAVGHRFVLDQGEKNMFPQNGNFNKSAYKTMENEWADWIDSGAEVRFKTEFEGTGARPGSVFVDYDVVDPATGKVIYQNSVEFANQAGQVFERVPAKDMKAMIK